MDSKSTSERFENVRDQESMVDIPLTVYPGHIFVPVRSQDRSGFPTSYVVVFFVCSVNSAKMRSDCLFC